MSEEEQQAAIGRLVMERTSAKRQHALIEAQITNLGILTGNIVGNVADPGKDPAKISMAVRKIDELAGKGGLDRLRALLVEYSELTIRIAEIGDTLKKAGAE